MADNEDKMSLREHEKSEELRTTLSTNFQADAKESNTEGSTTDLNIGKFNSMDSKPSTTPEDETVQHSDEEDWQDAEDSLTDGEETEHFLDASESTQLSANSMQESKQFVNEFDTKQISSPDEIPSNTSHLNPSAIHELNELYKQDSSNDSSTNVTSSSENVECGQGDADAFVSEALAGKEDEGEDEKKDTEKLEADDSLRLEREAAMSEEERESKRSEAQEHKRTGNDLFKKGEYIDSIAEYTEALEICPLLFKKDRSIMFGNRAACHVRLEHHDDAITDCTKALDLNPVYLKVYLRRAQVYELTEKLDEALADFQKVFELDPSNYEARAACLRLPGAITERNEKLKEEMMGKLKDLGNLVLRPFGLSTNNFQLNQDPNSGGYSVNFVQNPTNGK